MSLKIHFMPAKFVVTIDREAEYFLIPLSPATISWRRFQHVFSKCAPFNSTGGKILELTTCQNLSVSRVSSKYRMRGVVYVDQVGASFGALSAHWLTKEICMNILLDHSPSLLRPIR